MVDETVWNSVWKTENNRRRNESQTSNVHWFIGKATLCQLYIVKAAHTKMFQLLTLDACPMLGVHLVIQISCNRMPKTQQNGWLPVRTGKKRDTSLWWMRSKLGLVGAKDVKRELITGKYDTVPLIPHLPNIAPTSQMLPPYLPNITLPHLPSITTTSQI